MVKVYRSCLSIDCFANMASLWQSSRPSFYEYVLKVHLPDARHTFGHVHSGPSADCGQTERVNRVLDDMSSGGGVTRTYVLIR